MVLENAPPKGKGTIGGIKKQYVYVGIAGVGIAAIIYYRKKQQTASSSAGATVTDPAGNTCAALDPQSGYCPGTQEDLAYQGNLTPGIVGYDQYGNPIYSGSPSNPVPSPGPGPGQYTSNAQWAQASVTYLMSIEPNANPTTISDALGLYIAGQGVSDSQKQICEQAIAYEGLPPVAGANGNPPNFVTSSTPPSTKTTTVPNIVGLGLARAAGILDSAQLKHRNWGPDPKGTFRKVTKTKPAAGQKVKAGTYIDVSYDSQKAGK